MKSDLACVGVATWVQLAHLSPLVTLACMVQGWRVKELAGLLPLCKFVWLLRHCSSEDVCSVCWTPRVIASCGHELHEMSLEVIKAYKREHAFAIPGFGA